MIFFYVDVDDDNGHGDDDDDDDDDDLGGGREDRAEIRCTNGRSPPLLIIKP